MRHLILLLVTLNGWCQTPMDYKIYSVVIEGNVGKIDFQRDSITRVIVFQQLVPNENEVEYYGEQFYELEDEVRYSMLFYDTNTIKLIENPDIKEGLLTLEQRFFLTPKMDEAKFHLKTNVTTITKSKFDKYFKSVFGNDVSKGWKRFYRKNPGVFGIYGFSKIIYVAKYALLYMEHRAYGLYGSGDIYILQKDNAEWNIIKTLNIWMP